MRGFLSVGVPSLRKKKYSPSYFELTSEFAAVKIIDPTTMVCARRADGKVPRVTWLVISKSRKSRQYRSDSASSSRVDGSSSASTLSRASESGVVGRYIPWSGYNSDKFMQARPGDRPRSTPLRHFSDAVRCLPMKGSVLTVDVKQYVGVESNHPCAPRTRGHEFCPSRRSGTNPCPLNVTLRIRNARARFRSAIV